MVEAPEIKAVNRAVLIVSCVLMLGSGVEGTGFGAWRLFPVWRGKRGVLRVEDGGTRSSYRIQTGMNCFFWDTVG
jgi:hypothetical protein